MDNTHTMGTLTQKHYFKDYGKVLIVIEYGTEETWSELVLSFPLIYDVMNNWGANHGAISRGYIGANVITMCSML